jgi:hypothetical protein
MLSGVATLEKLFLQVANLTREARPEHDARRDSHFASELKALSAFTDRLNISLHPAAPHGATKLLMPTPGPLNLE